MGEPDTTQANGSFLSGIRVVGVRMIPFAVAVFPAAAILVAYGYEQGFADYFGMPKQFVQIQPESLVRAVLGIGIALSLSVLLASALGVFLKRVNGDSAKSLYFRQMAVLFFVLGSFDLHLNPANWLPPAIQIGGGIVFGWLSYCARQDAAWNEWAFKKGVPTKEENPYDAPNPPWDSRFAILFLLVFILGSLKGVGTRVGESDARKERVFWVVDHGGREYVILQRHGDVLVLGHLDRNAGTVGPEYIAVSLSNDTGLAFTRETLGELSASPSDYKS